MIHGPPGTAPLDRSVSSCVCRSLRSLFCRARVSLSSLSCRARASLSPFAVRVCRSLLCRASLSSLRVCRSLLCQSACVALSSLSCGLSDALQAVNTGSTGSDSNRMRDFDLHTHPTSEYWQRQQSDEGFRPKHGTPFYLDMGIGYEDIRITSNTSFRITSNTSSVHSEC